jgi:hypothetical protein
MSGLTWLQRSRRATVIGLALALSIATGGVVLAASSGVGFVPQKADQITNIDVLRMQIANYYGDPAKTGEFGADSNYANEASSVADAASRWIAARAGKTHGTPAIVLDVDDTTLTTWNYEVFSNWAYNPATNATYVLDELFPATPGMVEMVTKAADMGVAVFFITGRPTSQWDATLGNLTDSDNVGLDAGYPTPTEIDLTGTNDVGPGLFTKPPKTGPYPAYLQEPCADAIAAVASCNTTVYKTATRAYIESMGYEIIASFGDQPSDLNGGYADRTFKMPNPNYYLP